MQLNSKFLQKYGIILSFSVIFWGFFIGALVIGWGSFSILMLPLMQYLLFLWLQITNLGKTQYNFNQFQLQFDTLGNKEKYSKYFFYCSLIELVLVILMGIESKFHPQLVNSYFTLNFFEFLQLLARMFHSLGVLAHFYSLNSTQLCNLVYKNDS